ncbi:small GTPase superfamily, partial [Melampsora americana]
GGVGKSSMTLNFIRNEFFEMHDPTIDDSYTTTIIVDEVPWQIEILDTAGQEEYRGLWVEHAVSQGEAFICTYAINSTRSIEFLPTILNLIANVKNPKAYPFPFVIAGNKLDLSDQRQVPSEDGMRMATMTGGLFFECSAKTGVSVASLILICHS